MNGEGGMHSDAREPCVWWLLAALAMGLILRFALLATTVDAPGDGPTRAISAYEWSLHPQLVRAGFWPPGFTYLVGTVMLIVPYPHLAARLCNVVAGILTIVGIAALVRRAFGGTAAAFSALLLAALPVHAALSVTSLTEAVFVAEMIGAFLLIMSGLDGHRRPSRLIAGVLCAQLATMTRYEAWFLVPILALYVQHRGRDLRLTALVTLGVVAFPVFWIASNYATGGDPLPGLTFAKQNTEIVGAHPVSIIAALGIVARLAVRELGVAVAGAVVVGLCISVRRMLVSGIDSDRGAFLLLAAGSAALLIGVAMMLGKSLQPRHGVLWLVVMLPFASQALCLVAARGVRRALAAAAIASFFLLSPESRLAYLVPPSAATEMREVAAWLQRSEYRNESIMLTDMDWEVTYLALYWPEVSERQLIMSAWVSDRALAQLFAAKPPRLFVTRDSDAALKRRVELAFGRAIDDERLVCSIGATRLYDLEDRAQREAMRPE